jgi:hypothetical protein
MNPGRTCCSRAGGATCHQHQPAGISAITLRQTNPQTRDSSDLRSPRLEIPQTRDPGTEASPPAARLQSRNHFAMI